MRKLLLQEEAHELLMPYYTLLTTSMREAVTHVRQRADQDIAAGHVIQKPMWKAWAIHIASYNIFTRTLAGNPDLKFVGSDKSYGLVCHGVVDIWVKKLNGDLVPGNNHTPTSLARLNNESTLPGIQPCSVVLGYQVDVTGSNLLGLHLACHHKGERVWAIDVLNSQMDSTPIPFETATENVAPEVENVLQVLAHLRRNKKKAGNDGTT